MYTFRAFKDEEKINRMQVFLGKVYTVKDSTDEDKKLGIKLRITGSDNNIPDDGLAVYKDDHAFIMMSDGNTFECLNRPYWANNQIKDSIVSAE